MIQDLGSPVELTRVLCNKLASALVRDQLKNMFSWGVLHGSLWIDIRTIHREHLNELTPA